MSVFGGDGGYIVAAPSVHESGTKYKWNDIAPTIDGLADLLELPEDVRDFLKDNNKKTDTEPKNKPGWVTEDLRACPRRSEK